MDFHIDRIDSKPKPKSKSKPNRRSKISLLERTESATSLSSTQSQSSKSTTSASTSSAISLPAAGRWKYSKPRQLAFWVKKSVRDVMAQDLNSVYETTNEDSNRRSDRNDNDNSNDNDNRKGNTKISIAGDKNGDDGMDVIFQEEGCGWDNAKMNTEDYGSDSHACSESYLHPPCESIDEAMNALHTLTMTGEYQYLNVNGNGNDNVISGNQNDGSAKIATANEIEHHHHHHPYDWLLDGDPIEIDCDDDHNHNHSDTSVHHALPPQSCFNLPSSPCTKSQNSKGLGDEDLDCALAALELESTTTSELTTKNKGMMTMMSMNMNTMTDGFHQPNFLSESDAVDADAQNGIEANMDVAVEITVDNDDDDGDHCCDERDEECTRNANVDTTTTTTNTNTVIARTLQKGSETLHNHIPEFLPFEDPSTPEGSFVRRIQLEFDKDNHMNTNSNANAKNVAEMDLDLNRDLEFLPDGYCIDNDDENDEYDPVLNILESIPWEIGNATGEGTSNPNPDCNGNDNVMAMDVISDIHLIEKLSSLDEISRDVTDHLLHAVSRRDADICLAMKRAQAVDDDITSALSYANQAALYLSRARGRERGGGDGCHLAGGRGGVLGGIYVMEEASERDRLKKVDEVLRSIEEVVMMESSVFDFCDDLMTNIMSSNDSDGESRGNGGIASLLETCNTLKLRLLQDERLLRLSCLDESRARVSRIMDYSCNRLEEELRLFLYRQCNCNRLGARGAKTDVWSVDRWKEYSTLLNARLVFDDYQMQESKENVNKGMHDCPTEDETENGRAQIASAWAAGILGGLCFEADRCLAKALLHPTNNQVDDKHEEEPSEFDQNLMEIESKLADIQEFDENAASLRSMITNLVSIRFEFDRKDHHIIGVFHSLCLNLADVLHAHYIICEWHKNRLDSSSSGFRCDSPLQDEDESSSTNTDVERIDTATKDDYTKSTYSYSSHTSSSQSSCLLSRKNNNLAIPRCISGPETIEQQNSIFSRRKMTELSEFIEQKKLDLWFHCRGRIIAFLKIVIEMEENSADSSWSLTWLHDLDTFRGIYELCNQMNLLGLDFLGVQHMDKIPPLEGDSAVHCELRETLSEIFQKFVRGAHCDAMMEMGRLMATETWDLLPVPLKREGRSDSKSALQTGIYVYLKDLMGAGSVRLASQKVWQNRFMISNDHQYFLSYNDNGNPFVPLEASEGVKKKGTSPCNVPSDVTKEDKNHDADKLYDVLASYFSSETGNLVLGTKSSLNGLARWTARLLKIQSHLPMVSVTDQIATVLSNLYDLYFVTVFRLCCSNSTTESIIFGSQKRSDHEFQEHFPQDLPPSRTQQKKMKSGLHRSNSFSRRRNVSTEAQTISKTRLIHAMASQFCEADMNAPLPIDEECTTKARTFICRGQTTLSSMVKLDQIEKWSLFRESNSDRDERVFAAKCLEKRLAAASSILFVACLLDTSMSFHAAENSEHKKNLPLANYLKELTEAIIHVNRMCLRIASIRAINGRNVVLNILSIGTGWSDSNLHEHCNSYVDNLSDRYITLWTHLCTSPLRLLKEVLFDVWRYVVESGYLALLEGFSKIHDCSTEGRALMSIDLATFSSNIHKHTMVPTEQETSNRPFLIPPSVKPKQGMEYVDMYIKVFYFPDEDTMEWITQNRQRYHLSHLLTLVSIGAHNQLQGKHLHQLKKKREEVMRILLEEVQKS